jgi:hypothetical protein
MEPEFLIDTTRGKNMKLGVTVVIVFARLWCVKPFFDNFDRMSLPKGKVHLLVIDNTDYEDLPVALKKRLERYKRRLYSVRLYKTYRRPWQRGKMDGMPKGMWRSEDRR